MPMSCCIRPSTSPMPSSSDASTTSTPRPPPSPPLSYSTPSWLARHRSLPRRTTAFKAYSTARAPRARPRPGAPEQRMIKTCVSLLASVHAAMRSRELAAARNEGGGAQPPPSTTSQLHHMISERRRRERLNDSFQSLRALLPPGSKKDKANVLASTTEYMAKLISQVSQLQEQNLQLEAQLGLNRTASDDGSSEKIEVDVTTGASASSASSQPREVSEGDGEFHRGVRGGETAERRTWVGRPPAADGDEGPVKQAEREGGDAEEERPREDPLAGPLPGRRLHADWADPISPRELGEQLQQRCGPPLAARELAERRPASSGIRIGRRRD